MKHRRLESHLITGEEMNASCLSREKMEIQWGKGEHATGREEKGNMPQEERKRGK